MTELTGPAATQLANIEADTGMTRAQFVAEIGGLGPKKHGEIVSYLKTTHGMGHGNANLIAKLARDDLAGGPAAPDELLANQFQGAKAALEPIYEEIAAVSTGLGGDVDRVIQKTGVSFRRKKQFLVVQAPSSKRVQLGLNLPSTPDNNRVKETVGMCTHRVDVSNIDEVDDELVSWIRTAYEAAG